MKNKSLILVFLSVFFIIQTSAQSLNYKLKQANDAFEESNYTEAKDYYEQVLSLDSTNLIGRFGLANTYSNLNQLKEAQGIYEGLLQQSLPRDKYSDVLHNLGNIFMKNKDYAKAFESFKKAIILSPEDDDIRYNLVLAQKLMKKDPPKSQQNKQDQKDNQKDQEDKKDKKDEQKPQDKKENEKKDKKDKQKEESKKKEDQKDREQKGKQEQSQSDSQPQQVKQQQQEALLKHIKAKEEKTQKKIQQVKNFLKSQAKSKKKNKKNW